MFIRIIKTINNMTNNYRILLAAIIVIMMITGCKKQSVDNGATSNNETNNLLCFTAEEDGATIGMYINGTLTTIPNFEYSYDGNVWNQFNPGATVVTLDKTGDKIYFRGDNPNGVNFYNSSNLYEPSYVSFKIKDKKVAVSGNIMSLIDPTCLLKRIPCQGCFFMLFNQTKISTAPELPATELTDYCYFGMFAATTLTTAPKLPATVMADYCYSEMFAACDKLISAPELPATSLAIGCYDYMFGSCTKLNNLKVYFTNWADFTNGWLIGVQSTGTFICPSTLPQVFDYAHIPEGWSVETF